MGSSMRKSNSPDSKVGGIVGSGDRIPYWLRRPHSILRLIVDRKRIGLSSLRDFCTSNERNWEDDQIEPEPIRIRQHRHIENDSRKQNRSDDNAVSQMFSSSQPRRQPRTHENGHSPRQDHEYQYACGIPSDMSLACFKVSGVQPGRKWMEDRTHSFNTNDKQECHYQACNDAGGAANHCNDHSRSRRFWLRSPNAYSTRRAISNLNAPQNIRILTLPGDSIWCRTLFRNADW